MPTHEYGLYDAADGGLLAYSASSGWIDSERDCTISEREAMSRKPSRRGGRTVPDVDRDELRTAAENATPGPWGQDAATDSEGDVITLWQNDDGDYLFLAHATFEDSAFIAAADPPTVLAMLDALAAAEARADRAEGAIDRALDVTALGGSVSNLRGVVDEMRRHLAAYREETGRAPEWSDPEPWRCGMHPGERFQVGDRDSGTCSWIRSPRTREQYDAEEAQRG